MVRRVFDKSSQNLDLNDAEIEIVKMMDELLIKLPQRTRPDIWSADVQSGPEEKRAIAQCVTALAVKFYDPPPEINAQGQAVIRPYIQERKKLFRSLFLIITKMETLK